MKNYSETDLIKLMEMYKRLSSEGKRCFEESIGNINQIEEKLKKRGYSDSDQITKALYMVDMNNGFVRFGSMANPNYNDLVSEQQKMINKFRQENQLVNFILEGHRNDALEFASYPEHCILGTKEADLIDEYIPEQIKPNTMTYYKNCINGMLNRDLQDDIKLLKNLKEIVIEGVCADLCVMDFARTYARYLDEINHEAKIFVVRNAIDTFDAPGHSRDEWLDIAEKVMRQAGIIMVDDIVELENQEKKLKLR